MEGGRRTRSHEGEQAGAPRHAGSLTFSGTWALVTSSDKSGDLDPNGDFLKCFPRLFPNGRGRKLFHLKHWLLAQSSRPKGSG